MKHASRPPPSACGRLRPASSAGPRLRSTNARRRCDMLQARSRRSQHGRGASARLDPIGSAVWRRHPGGPCQPIVRGPHPLPVALVAGLPAPGGGEWRLVNRAPCGVVLSMPCFFSCCTYAACFLLVWRSHLFLLASLLAAGLPCTCPPVAARLWPHSGPDPGRAPVAVVAAPQALHAI